MRMRIMLYPLRFESLYYQKVWGGRRLQTELGRSLPPGEPVGESWEVADHSHGRSVIANGPLRGTTLHQIVQEHPEGVLGAGASHSGAFPLLVKYIDADDRLSVQVHPDDTYAQTRAGEHGKTEMWYVLHADPGAELIAGLAPGTTRDIFLAALREGDPAGLLHHFPVRAGDSIFIPAGRIHAILPGLVILEIQQNSDTTFRLYDWGRMGLDGHPRPLHVDEATAVANWYDYTPQPGVVSRETGNTAIRTELAACPYFIVDKLDLTGEWGIDSFGATFSILNCVAGSGELRWEGGSESLDFADTLLIPAALPRVTLVPHGHCAVVRSYLPPRD